MNYWYGDNPNCGRCGHLNGHGHCNMTACIYPVIETTTMVTPEIKPRTNYDLIISKTPEELAEWIVEIADCDECEKMHGFRMCDAAPEKSCADCWAGWLTEEAEK